MFTRKTIENWDVISDGGRAKLQGRVIGHARGPGKELVLTAPIVHADGNQVACEEDEYVLGTPDKRFLERCSLKGVHFDPKAAGQAVHEMAEILDSER